MAWIGILLWIRNCIKLLRRRRHERCNLLSGSGIYIGRHTWKKLWMHHQQLSLPINSCFFTIAKTKRKTIFFPPHQSKITVLFKAVFQRKSSGNAADVSNSRLAKIENLVKWTRDWKKTQVIIMTASRLFNPMIYLEIAGFFQTKRSSIIFSQQCALIWSSECCESTVAFSKTGGERE